MNETPMTDAEEKRTGWPSFYYDFARQLELKLAEARHKQSQLEDSLRIEHAGNRIEIGRAEKAEDERDQWREVAERLVMSLQNHVDNYMVSPVSSGANEALTAYNEMKGDGNENSRRR